MKDRGWRIRLACALALLALAVGGAWRTPAAAQSLDPPRRDVWLKRSILVVVGADPEAGQVQLMEKLLLQNDGGGPYQPARWEDSVVRVRFPQEATELSLEAGPPGADLVPVPGDEGTYALAGPLPPGEQSLVVSYALPYAAGGLRVRYRPAMTAQAAQVLLPASAGVELRPVARALRSMPDLALGGQTYRILEAAQLAAGSDASFELRGLPTAPSAGRLLPGGQLAEVPLVVTAALLLGGALIYGLVRR